MIFKYWVQWNKDKPENMGVGLSKESDVSEVEPTPSFFPLLTNTVQSLICKRRLMVSCK